MEYTNIISLVPKEENFDAFVVGEGVWLTEPHLNAIENALTTNATGTSALQETINTSAQEIESLKEQLNGSKVVITEKETKITELETEIANLKAAAAKPAATTVSTEDPKEGAVVVESEATKEAKRLRALRDN